MAPDPDTTRRRLLATARNRFASRGIEPASRSDDRLLTLLDARAGVA